MDLGHERALYSISVTSELTGVQPQMLRTYEDKGLLTPFRTEGGTRRYSGHDVDRIGQITTLLAAGLNLAGVEQVLGLLAETDRLHAEIAELQLQLHDSGTAAAKRRSMHRDGPHE